MGVVSAIFVGLNERMANAGVEYMVNAGSNPVTSKILNTGVNAGKTTSLERAKWELITLSGGKHRAQSLSTLVTPIA